MPEMPVGSIAKPAVKIGDPASGGTVGELGQKKQNIDEYEQPVAKPIVTGSPVTDTARDRITPTARYGARGGEQRISPNELGRMTKPLGMQSFEKGTSYVKKTGPAILHKGEAVIAKEKNPMKMKDKAKAVGMEALGDKSKPKKEIKEMVHSKSHNGHHIVVHKHHHPEHHPDETHTLENMAALHQHMEDHAGTPNDGEGAESAPQGGAPAPMTAAPSPMPPAGGAGLMPGPAGM